MLTEIPFKDRTIIMTVAQYEAKLNEWFELGRKQEREIQAFRTKLNADHNLAIDRFKSAFPEIMEKLGIGLPKEEATA